MDTDRDLYHILQIDPAAEQEVVQAAFKRLALKYHPDRNASPDAHSRMQALNDAYAIIGDPAQRAAYDCERRDRLQAQRQAEEQARQQADAERRAESTRFRKEQQAAQRRAANERQEQARATAAQRRIEYEAQIRAQQIAQRRAKRERQQREWEAQQAAAEPVAAAQSAAPIETSAPQPEVLLEAVIGTQVRVEAEPGPIDVPVLSECERRKLALQQSRQALQNEIFKLDYGIMDAADQVNYWSNRRFPLQIEVKAGQDMPFTIGGAITVVALLLTGFTLTLGGAIGWAAAFGLVGIGTGWWTWRTSLSVVPVAHWVATWTEIKRGRELRQQHLTQELAQLEVVMRVSATKITP